MKEFNFFDAETLAYAMDHTLLKAYATEDDYRRICDEARQYGFHTVAIQSGAVSTCKPFLEGCKTQIDVGIGFPLGQNTISCKLFETEQAIRDGAGEADYVVHIGKLKEKNYRYIQDEMEQIVRLCREADIVSKVIFENCYLTDEEKQVLCKIACEARPDFIKTSTGFGTGGATVEDIRLMRAAVDDGIKVKASGGVRNFADFRKMVEAGAERIGTSCAPAIVEEMKQLNGAK